MKTPEEIVERLTELEERVILLEQGKRIPFERPAGPTDKNWPSWRYPPEGGAGKIFHNKKDVPKGWLDAPFVPGAEPEEEVAA